jgi:G3E family GTPase
MSTAHYIMIGGFLGAGKTTAVTRFAHYLSERGKKVGLITNDQGSQLVDSLTLRAHGFAVEEIAGGCFCCRFASLKDAADKLTEETKPDIFIAEPVGSCTDLVATVTYPLRRLYGADFTVAPLSVLVDPPRAMKVLGIATHDDGKRLSDKVVYIYKKQLEEADYIIINKSDQLSAADRDALDAALAKEFPRAKRFIVSARSGDGLDAWFTAMLTQRQGAGSAMQVDYDVYAEGEALLGWFNCTVAVNARAARDQDGNALIMTLMKNVQQTLHNAGAEIAHLKMTLSPSDGSNEIATANVVGSERRIDMAQELSDDIEEAQLIINLRAEGAPELLENSVTTALSAMERDNHGVRLVIDHRECFRPGRPVPTHRFSAAGADV